MSDEAASATRPAAEQVEKKEEGASATVTDAAPAEDKSDKPAGDAGASADAEATTKEADSAAAAASSDDAEAKKAEGEKEDAPAADSGKDDAAKAADQAEPKETEDKPADDATEGNSKEEPDAEMKDADNTEAPAASDPAEASAAVDDSAVADAVATPSGADKSKARRKSNATPAKNKKLNKKGSRVFRIHVNPGDHFLVKLKGYPQWPVIIADEEMLPEQLIKTRPVTARRADGTYREDYADDGKKANDRTYPVMYLRTNEFGWVPNAALQELPANRAQELLTDKVKKKELREAFELAIEQNSLEHYKSELADFQQKEDAKRVAREEAASRKQKRQSVSVAKDEDVDMADVGSDEPAEKPKSAKKRKAEEAATPQRSESAKKPKIKLTTSSTPKGANGTSSSKTKDAAKPKVKAKKDQEEKKKEEPQLTPEEAHERKSKEVLFLRHKLQKGLLAREGIPKEEEMKMMSEYINKLENFPDLEVSIIRTTKINKVLKAILKLESIPKESEFNFKSRSQVLLDKWTKILNSSEGGVAAPGANGTNGSAEKKAESTPTAEANGVKEDDKAAEKGEDAADEPAAAASEEKPEESEDKDSKKDDEAKPESKEVEAAA